MKRLLSRSCKDDRGASVEVLSHAAAGHWVVSGDARIEGMMYRAAYAKGPPGILDRLALVGTGAAIVAIIIPTLVFVPHLAMWVFPTAVVIGIGGAAWLVPRVSARRHVARICATILEEGLCASCGYNLHGLNSEADGCAVCPECGAAWSVDRIARTEPIAPGAVHGDPLAISGKQAARLVTDAWDSFDDRGGPVRILHARLKEPIERSRDEQERERLIGLRRRLLRKTVAYRWVVSAIMLGIAVAAIWKSGGAAPMTIIIPLVMCGSFLFGSGGISPATVRKTLLSAGACAACAEELRGAEADKLGVVECPRCRASWRFTPSSSDRSGP